MYPTVKGVYKKGKVEIAEPVHAQEGEEVLITFLKHGQIEKRGSLKGIWGGSDIDEDLMEEAKHSVFKYEK